MNRGDWPVPRGPGDVFSGKRKAHNAGSGYMSEESLASSMPSSASTAALHAELKAMKARLDGFEAAGPQPVFPPQSSGNSILGHANCPPPWPTFAPFYTQKEQCKKLPFFERVFSRPMKLGVQNTLSTLLLHDD